MKYYATKSINIDGKHFNNGDIIPERYMTSATAKRFSRKQGQPKVAPALPEVGMTSEEIRSSRRESEIKVPVAKNTVDAEVKAEDTKVAPIEVVQTEETTSDSVEKATEEETKASEVEEVEEINHSAAPVKAEPKKKGKAPIPVD